MIFPAYQLAKKKWTAMLLATDAILIRTRADDNFWLLSRTVKQLADRQASFQNLFQPERCPCEAQVILTCRHPGTGEGGGGALQWLWF